VLRQIDDQIRELQRRFEDTGGTDAWVSSQIEGLQAIRAQYQEFYDAVGSFQEAEAQRAKDLWKGVADSIQDGLGRGLEALITRTGTLKDVLNDMFRSITRSVVNYLAQLAFAQAGSAFGSMLGGPSGSSFDFSKAVGTLFGAVAGGGGDKPGFANGGAFTNGIVSGPVNFGIGQMGEAGPEGILPLANVGGRLGVHARGGGETNINITALDAGSVRELFFREGSALVQALAHRERLNRGMR
jgi:hypothetical protein